MSGASSGPVRIGVIGLGYWGPNLARNIQELPQAEMAALCDQREEALERVAARYPNARRTTSVDDLLNDDTIDAVAIATPVSTHHPLVAQALAAGKHVFVEKPLAGSCEEAVDLIERAAEADRVLMPGHTFLYSPPVTYSRELIRSGALGEIYFISTSRVNLGLHQPDVSVVWDLAPHDFSILRFWLDEAPVRVTALSRSCVIAGTPDVAFINLEYASGAIAHVELSWLAPIKLRRTAVAGSQKMLVYDDTSPEPVRIFDSGADLTDPDSFGKFQLTYRTGDIVSPRLDAAEPLALEMADFCNAVITGQTPTSSAEVGLDVVRMAEAVERSLEAGGHPVDVAGIELSR